MVSYQNTTRLHNTEDLDLNLHRRESLKSRIFPSRFPTKILTAFRVSPMRATRRAHFILLDLITVITRAVCKVRGLTLLLRVGTLWRCGDGLFFEVPPLASDALLTTLHPLLENVLQTVCRKLQEDSGTSGSDLGAPFSWLKKPRNRMG
jgi:hypothetical protein